jgi:hypothetical protein
VVDPLAQIQPYVRPGEQVLWAGRPDPTVRFTRADMYLIPFSVMWGGFALFWETAVITNGAPLFFMAWGVPFVAIGLYFIFGRFIYKRRRKERTAYAITTGRALVAVDSRSLVDSPIRYTPTTIQRSRDGRHVTAIIGNSGGFFNNAAMYGNTGMDFFNRTAVNVVAFYDVADGAAMLQALDKARGT